MSDRQDWSDDGDEQRNCIIGVADVEAYDGEYAAYMIHDSTFAVSDVMHISVL